MPEVFYKKKMSGYVPDKTDKHHLPTLLILSKYSYLSYPCYLDVQKHVYYIISCELPKSSNEIKLPLN